jgi:ubiquitin C-terminal hydrolase
MGACGSRDRPVVRKKDVRILQDQKRIFPLFTQEQLRLLRKKFESFSKDHVCITRDVFDALFPKNTDLFEVLDFHQRNYMSYSDFCYALGLAIFDESPIFTEFLSLVCIEVPQEQHILPNCIILIPNESMFEFSRKPSQLLVIGEMTPPSTPSLTTVNKTSVYESGLELKADLNDSVKVLTISEYDNMKSSLPPRLVPIVREPDDFYPFVLKVKFLFSVDNDEQRIFLVSNKDSCLQATEFIFQKFFTKASKKSKSFRVSARQEKGTWNFFARKTGKGWSVKPDFGVDLKLKFRDIARDTQFLVSVLDQKSNESDHLLLHGDYSHKLFTPDFPSNDWLTTGQGVLWSEDQSYIFETRARSTSSSTNLGGLMNLGNTCFLNAVLQCLASTELFANYFLNPKNFKDISKKEYVIAAGVHETLKKMSKGSLISPKKLKELLSKEFPFYAGKEQHDAHELLLMLLEKIHTEMNHYKPSEILHQDSQEDSVSSIRSSPEGPDHQKFWLKHHQTNLSPITDLFEGLIENAIVCSECSHKSSTYEVVRDLPLLLSNVQPTQLYLQWLESDKDSMHSGNVSFKRIAVGSIEEIYDRLPWKHGNTYCVLRSPMESKSFSCIPLKEIHKIRQGSVISLVHIPSEAKNPAIIVCHSSNDSDVMFFAFCVELDVAKEPGEDLQQNIWDFLWEAFHPDIHLTLPETFSSKDSVLYQVDLDWKNSIPKELLNVSFEPPISRYSLRHKDLTLHECLSAHFASEKLDDWKCEGCQSIGTCSKRSSFKRLPEHLIIVAKRFGFTSSGGAVKLSVSLEFPEEDLVISDEVYDLYATIEHHGTVQSGHYTATVLKDDWMFCNDTVVKEWKSKKSVSEAQKTTAYVLFYKLRSGHKDNLVQYSSI